MNMMKTGLIFLLILTFSMTGIAQEKDKGEIEALKIAYITDALDLTTSEAQEFWPVYNEYNEKWEKYRTQLHCGVYDQMDKLREMTEAEAEALLKEYMNLRERESQWRKNYVNDLKKVISAKRIMMLKKAEYEFHKKLLKEYRSGKKDG
jgi:hypothetical protein